MDERWARLGKALAASRRSQNLTQGDVATAAGVGLATIQGIERGTEVKDVTASMRVYASIVGWAHGSIEAVLDGREPDSRGPLVNSRTSGRGAMPEGLPVRVVQALSDGTALDTRVVPLTPDADMVVLVMGKGGASQEAIRAALEAWERREGHLDRLGDVSDDPSDSDTK